MHDRRFFNSNGLRLSYVDFGGNSDKILVVLHGHFGTANQFSFLAQSLNGWRVIGLDQRGHGWSEHALNLDYSRESYIDDMHQFIQSELEDQPVVILGHSLGGANAYQFAAKHPQLVKAMIIEDIGAVCQDDLSWARKFPKRTSTLREMGQAVDAVLDPGSFPYFSESLVEFPDGWGFRFHVEGLIHSQQSLNGEWWNEWKASTCPTLLLRGERSPILPRNVADQMLVQMPHVKFIEFKDAGHTLHAKDPERYARVVQGFLNEVCSD